MLQSDIALFRPMNLKLDRSRERRRTARNPSPPCPHVWESHEDIDRLVEDLKTAFVANKITSVKTSTTKEIVETIEERKCRVVSEPPRSRVPIVQLGRQGDSRSLKTSDDFGLGGVRRTEEQGGQGQTDAVEECSSKVDRKIFYQGQVVNVEHKHERHVPEKTVALTPPLSSPAEDHSGSSHSTVVAKRQHVSVRERAKLLQQKVEEDYLSMATSQDESASEGVSGEQTSSRRAEEIPGAVRVLPPMPGSRTPSGGRGSLPRRGSSVDSAGVSPLTVSRASPFSRRAESQPPPMYVPPPAQSPARQQARGRAEFSGSYSYRAMDINRFSSRQVYASDAGTTSVTASAVPSCTTSACSTLDRAFLLSGTGECDEGLDRRRTPVGAYDSEVDELTTPHYKKRPFRSDQKGTQEESLGPAKTRRARDGYEADTDDTLARRRGSSVKEMARWIQVCPII